MKNKYLIVFSLALILSSCSNNDSPDNNLNEDFEAQFSGNMITGNINNEIDGKVSISETGSFLLESFIGRITGNAELENDIYIITDISGDGAFESSTFTNGQLNLTNLNLNLNGNYIDSSTIVINGGVEIIWIEEYEQIWTDARSKSSVFFSHNELCSASITIDGITLENLGPHYNENGAFCDQSTYGELFTTKYHQDVDNAISKTICTSVTLYDPITDEYNTYEQCVLSKFIVDKNTQYTYTVNWDNGYSYTDTFISADGGQGVTICPTNPLEDCDGSGGNTGGDHIFENTIVIDYSISNTSETEQFSFNDVCFFDLDNEMQMTFGGETDSYLTFFINGWETPLHVGTYAVGDLEDQLFVDCYIVDWNHEGVSGTVDITYLENDPINGGELHATFNNVKVKRYTNEEYFVFSGTIKGRWGN